MLPRGVVFSKKTIVALLVGGGRIQFITMIRTCMDHIFALSCGAVGILDWRAVAIKSQ